MTGCTTASPAPLREPVLSPPLATSSSAPASSTRFASHAATRRSVTGPARRNAHSHQLASQRARRGPSRSLFFPPSSADRPPSARKCRFGELEVYKNRHLDRVLEAFRTVCRAEGRFRHHVCRIHVFEVMWRTSGRTEQLQAISEDRGRLVHAWCVYALQEVKGSLPSSDSGSTPTRPPARSASCPNTINKYPRNTFTCT